MRPRFLLAPIALLVSFSTAPADEGMWPFHNPPAKRLQKRFGFVPSQEWLDHVRLSSIRFGRGGSASFVSPHGLVLTNHHVGLDSIHKLSTAERDLVANGFLAQNLDQELKVPGLQLQVLVKMKDVTRRVKAAVPDATPPEEAVKLRRAETSRIQREAKEKTGLESEVVSLYRGGEYWLYQYETYDDVRLVFAPEATVGYFGGDPDNFTYPRFNLDFSLFRVWKDGRPLETEHYLRVNPDGVHEGDLVFVSGHPGRTERLMTLAQIKRLRDVERPRSLALIERLIAAASAYAATGPEPAREAQDLLFGLRNAQKAYTGQLEGLRDPRLMKKKEDEERALRDEVQKRPRLKERVGDAWKRIKRALKELDAVDDRAYYSRLRGDLAQHALDIVRAVVEFEKPDTERLPDYREANRAALERRLFSAAPIHTGLEQVLLRTSLELAREKLGADDPFVRAALGDRSPEKVARSVARKTRLGDPDVRRRLLEGGREAVAKSDDPAIRLALRVDPVLRELREKVETIRTEIALASERIAEARFAVYGNSVYPDATFTLRLAYGVTEGYEEDTTLVPWKTTFYGLYERSHAFDNAPPFHLPERFFSHESRLDLTTPLDFVHTADITGGNSGSPTLNRAGELVGLIFDGNIQSLPNDFVFKNADDRAVSVHVGAILEALEKLYDAPFLAREMLGISGPRPGATQRG